jgi:hypothetical protein
MMFFTVIVVPVFGWQRKAQDPQTIEDHGQGVSMSG